MSCLWEGDAKEFAASLSESWKHVRYDAVNNVGNADLGLLKLRFWEHSSDPAVCVEVALTRRIKGSAEDVIEMVEKIQQAIRNSD